MAELPFDVGAVPLRAWLYDLEEELFPRLLRNTARVALGVHGRARERPPRLRRPAALLAKLRGVRSSAACRCWLLRRTVKEMCSLYYVVQMFLLDLAKMQVDWPNYRWARRRLGKRPTTLSLLRTALRYWAERE